MTPIIRSVLIAALVALPVACSSPGLSKPTIIAFSATPETLPAGGGTVRLAWRTASESALRIDPGVGSVSGSERTVDVTTSTVFTLTASNGAGQTTSASTVSVAPADPPPPPARPPPPEPPPAPPPVPPPPTPQPLDPPVVTGQFEHWTRGTKTLSAESVASSSILSVAQTQIGTGGQFSLTLPNPGATQLRPIGGNFGCPASAPPEARFVWVRQLGISSGNTRIGLGVLTPDPPTSAGGTSVAYLYADRPSTVTGSCPSDNAGRYALTLEQGWNRLIVQTTGSSTQYASNPVPSGTRWVYLPRLIVTLDAPLSPLRIGQTAIFTASARDPDGAVVTGVSYVWESSDPNNASVDPNGVVTPKHLGPFSVTARAQGGIGVGSSATITPYGLEAAGGTFNAGSGPPGTAFAIAFLDQDGEALTGGADLSLSGPVGWNSGSSLGVTLLDSRPWTWFWTPAAPVSGTYTVTGTIGGAMYTAQLTVDPTDGLNPVTDLTATDVSSSGMDLNWTPLPNALIGYEPAIRLPSTGQRVDGLSSGPYAPPLRVNGLALIPGSYEVELIAYTWTDSLAFAGLPARFNVSKVTRAFTVAP